MIRYTPSYILADWNSRVFDFNQPNFYLPLWEHFAREAVAWDRGHLESINDTSSINNHILQGFSTRKQVHKALARVFSQTGASTLTGGFLRHCGIKQWTDLDKPIPIKGWDRDVPFEGDVLQRQMRSPGPNDCHPDAVFGQYASIEFDADWLRWRFHVHYGYSHDSSSWRASLDQKPRESLYHFGQRIPDFIELLFEPEDQRGAELRSYRNQQYATAHRAVRDLFYDELRGTGERLLRAIMDMPSVAGMRNRHIILTDARLRTIEGWIKRDCQEHVAKKGETDG